MQQQQQKKLRRATMLLGSLKSARRTAHSMLTLKSNLVLVGCWPAFLHAQVNVAELMGKLALIRKFLLPAIVIRVCFA